MIPLNKHYVPFKRLFHETDGSVGVHGTGKVFKTIRGSERNIVSPYEAIVENTVSLMRVMEQNNVAKAINNLKVTLTEVGLIVMPAVASASEAITKAMDNARPGIENFFQSFGFSLPCGLMYDQV